jgi:CheY-like chemotaxis protein
MNLAANARDAMPGGGFLRLETSHFDVDASSRREYPNLEPASYVQLTVTDSGAGMDAATKNRIFEPFFTTKSGQQGTGLGLATVFGIVEQAGGTIAVSSEPNKGSTFKIYLPMAEGGEIWHEPEPQPEVIRGTETILLVEDQSELRDLAEEILERHGYTVLAAASGREAIHLAERHPWPIQLMLTDVVMPGMTGRQLADRLKPARPAMKVLYMSGYTDDVVVRHGTLTAGVAYLQKPFTPESLAGKVREVLESTPPAKILVVDDEAGIRRLIRQALEAAGYGVLEAADGRDAIAQLKSHPVDAMIIDLVMPGQEGIETIRLTHEMRPELAIVAMSGAVDGSALAAASRLGTQAALAKPFNDDQLLDTIRDVLALQA